MAIHSSIELPHISFEIIALSHAVDIDFGRMSDINSMMPGIKVIEVRAHSSVYGQSKYYTHLKG